ncbi:alkaline phosphatase family protein [Yeosuana marina]|tara:strand:+ start:1718 stop:1861 length:144 start_codon:yes stop_codon:yes gene_type:complete
MNHPTNLSSKFDHVVVLMLENRSFDNLLGYLYEDHVPEGKTFEGLQG